MRRDFVVRDKQVFPKKIIHCSDGMDLIKIIESIIESNKSGYYECNIYVYPLAIIGDLQSILIPPGINILFPIRPIDLVGLRMPYANFSQRNIPGILFGEPDPSLVSDLGSSNFSYSNVTRGVFMFANLVNSHFFHSDARDARFDGANLTNSDFSFADLTRAIFAGATLAGARFPGANLTNATLPDNANTKELFKALVGYYDPVTTIWIDGLPIG